MFQSFRVFLRVFVVRFFLCDLCVGFVEVCVFLYLVGGGAVEMYPSEAIRAELSVKLGLTDRQLQMWFCHRRLKDKNNLSEKKSRKSAAVVGTKEGIEDGLMAAAEPGSDYGSGSGSGSSPYASRELQGMVLRRDGHGSATGRRCYESPRTIMELRAIACVEAQLGEPLREDGPILGMEFDPLPPDAFGAPLGNSSVCGH